MGAAAATKSVATVTCHTDDGGSNVHTGLENFGTTCYCNSIIQALYFCSPFRKKLFEYNRMVCNIPGNLLLKTAFPSGGERKDALLAHLTNLFYDIASVKNDKAFVSPKTFISKLKTQNLMFNNDDHHDAHEFLNFLLNDIIESVHFDTKTLKSQCINLKQSPCLDTVAEDEKSWVEKIFGGTIQCKMTCILCERISIVDQNVLDISVETIENSTLSDCLLHATNQEYMQGIDKVFCEYCNTLQEGRRSIHMVAPPEVLAIHLKRFKFIEQLQQFKKLRHKVVFPETLDFDHSRRDGRLSTTYYHLRSVIAHIGNGPMEGHYITMVREDSSSWFLFDDDVVEPINADLVQSCYGSGEKVSSNRQSSQTGYILFYEMV
jgi:ubiquitin carboxyl-terminal hydrolase 12/46